MKITRQMVVASIIRQSHQFPNCDLKRVGDDLFIKCMNGQFKPFTFRASFPNDPKIKTYYENWKHLSDHPEIEIIQVVDDITKRLSVSNALRKEYV